MVAEQVCSFFHQGILNQIELVPDLVEPDHFLKNKILQQLPVRLFTNLLDQNLQKNQHDLEF